MKQIENVTEQKALSAFFNSFSSVFYKKGDIILSAGRNSDFIFYVEEGLVHNYMVSSNGNAFIINWLTVSNFFPTFIFSEKRINSYFQAFSPVEIKRAPKRDFIDMLKKDSSLFMYVSQTLSATTLEIVERFEHLLLSNRIEDRVLYLVMILAHQFGKIQGAKAEIPWHLTHEDIASYVATTRESVTCSLTNLVKSGILRIEKEKIIANDFLSLQQKF